MPFVKGKNFAKRSGPSGIEHLGDRDDGIPVARRRRDPKEPVQRAKVADDLHVAPVYAEDEPVVPGEDLQQPLAARRKILMGVDGAVRGLLDRTLTKRTTSGRTGWSAKGS